MNTENKSSNTTAVVKLTGRFTFDNHKEFRSAFSEHLSGKGNQITIDFGGVEYIDSAALGMLLLARERAGEQGKTVVLSNCRGPVKAVLDIANFQRLFSLSRSDYRQLAGA